MNLLSYLHRGKKTVEYQELPVILLINSLSGGNKGAKVIELLEKQKNEKIKVFDLKELSQMEDHFNEFVTTYAIIIRDLWEQSKKDEPNRSEHDDDDDVQEHEYEHKYENNNNNKNKDKEKEDDQIVDTNKKFTNKPKLKRLHPRILICGGDGTIAWGLSLLDRALLQPPILSLYEQMPEFQETYHQLLIGTKKHSHRRSICPFYPQKKEEEEENSNSEPSREKNQDEVVGQFLEKNWSASKPSPSISTDSDNDNGIPIFPTENHPSNQHNQYKEDQNNENEKKTAEQPENAPQPTEEKLGNITSEIKTATNKIEEKIIERKEEEITETKKKDLMLQTIYNTHLAPVFSVLPLGTGNNFCRCIGTGHSYPKSRRVVSVVENLMKDNQNLTRVDRWTVVFKDQYNGIQQRQMNEMMCYFSIGAIAQISHSFRKARLVTPHKLNKRWKNKLQYLLSGGKTAWEELTGSAKPLNDLVELYVNQQKVKLPTHCRSIVVSNLNSMADGINFWGTASSDPKDIQHYSEPGLGDGLLEIMASKGLYKYVQMSVGVSHYRRLGQSHQVSVRLHGFVPILIDGEAWVEGPGTIEFHLKNQMIAIVGNAEQPRGLHLI